jgi:hypothetical protein
MLRYRLPYLWVFDKNMNKFLLDDNNYRSSLKAVVQESENSGTTTINLDSRDLLTHKLRQLGVVVGTNRRQKTTTTATPNLSNFFRVDLSYNHKRVSIFRS